MNGKEHATIGVLLVAQRHFCCRTDLGTINPVASRR